MHTEAPHATQATESGTAFGRLLRAHHDARHRRSIPKSAARYRTCTPRSSHVSVVTYSSRRPAILGHTNLSLLIVRASLQEEIEVSHRWCTDIVNAMCNEASKLPLGPTGDAPFTHTVLNGYL